MGSRKQNGDYLYKTGRIILIKFEIFIECVAWSETAWMLSWGKLRSSKLGAQAWNSRFFENHVFWLVHSATNNGQQSNNLFRFRGNVVKDTLYEKLRVKSLRWFFYLLL
jgi:hypothetical protein